MNQEQYDSRLEKLDRAYNRGELSQLEYVEMVDQVNTEYIGQLHRTNQMIAQTQRELERQQDITKFVYGSLR